METGRPSDYTEELAKTICRRIAEGKSLRSVCQMEDIPDMSTVWRWITERPEFRNQYAQACEERAEAHNEMLLELGDEAINLAQEVNEKASSAVVQAVKLKADNLKWHMSKMKPKKYGDKLDLTTAGKELPQPILKLDVLRNHSHAEDSGDAQENTSDTGWDISK